MKRLVALLSRYGLLLLWLAFGPITANAARDPGFVLNGETVPYPWTTAVATWGILGLETAVVYMILRRRRGFPIAFTLVALLFAGSVLTTVTDMPGYVYVPSRYHLALLLTLGAAWTFTVADRRGRQRNHPGGTAA